MVTRLLPPLVNAFTKKPRNPREAGLHALQAMEAEREKRRREEARLKAQQTMVYAGVGVLGLGALVYLSKRR